MQPQYPSLPGLTGGSLSAPTLPNPNTGITAESTPMLPPTVFMGVRANNPMHNVTGGDNTLSTKQTLPANAGSGWPNQTPVPNSGVAAGGQDSGLYGQLIRSGVDAANQSAALTGQIAKAKQDVAGNPNYSLDTQVGRQGLIQQNIGTQATALANQSNAYFAGANLAAPIQAPYTNQVISPVSGKSIQGDRGALDPVSQISSLAADVVAGRKSPSAAQALLGNNSSFNSALNAAIVQLNPNFNFQQAETNAQTSGTLAPSIQNASKVLGDVNNPAQGSLAYALQNAPWYQKTGVPFLNALGGLFSQTTGIGLTGGRQLTVSVGDARNAISNALGSAYNTTPTSFDAYVKSLIPDNPTPQDVTGAINQLGSLFGIRTDIYSQAGNVPQYGQGGTTSGGWF